MWWEENEKGGKSSLTRDDTTSLQSDNVDHIGEIKDSLMIEVGVTEK